MNNPFGKSDRLRTDSISRRFSYAFVGVVSLILLVFATVAIYVNAVRLNTTLEERLDHNLHIAQVSLVIPMWNFDSTTINGFVSSLFADDGRGDYG